MHCWPVRRCFSVQNHLYCYTTYQCMPPVYPSGTTGPVVGPGPVMGTMGLRFSTQEEYKKCMKNCQEQGGYNWECQGICAAPKPVSYFYSDPEPPPWYFDPIPVPW
ncbi:hypothetical protein ACFTSE_26360 [Bacillus cereus]|uniref:hypothetical protein n=1 Tax=Bacillus cereus TaxID=1396 RepID=UPI00363BAFF2